MKKFEVAFPFAPFGTVVGVGPARFRADAAARKETSRSPRSSRRSASGGTFSRCFSPRNLLLPAPDLPILSEPVRSARVLRFICVFSFHWGGARVSGLAPRKDSWYSLFFRGDSGNSPGVSESKKESCMSPSGEG